MRLPRSLFYAQNNSLCLLLIYTLAISLFAPFAIKHVGAITIDKTISRSPSKSALAPVKAPATIAAKSQEQKSKWREGELLVRFRDHAPAQKMNELLRANGAQWNGQLRGPSGIERLSLKAGSDPEMVAAALRSSELIEFAEPNYLITADQTTQAAPDDPRFSEQWALKNTGVPQAWGTTTGSKQTVIAVIDGGIDFTHPDLKNNEWDNSLEQANNLDNDSNGYTSDLHGWDFVSDSSGTIDEQGHGTAIAGIIAAEGNNSVGITGVMWRASLMSLRVLDNTGTGDIAGAIEAIDYATTNGAQVINCSWGTDESSVALREAINRAAQRGVVVVASAGNQARDIETTLRYPASFDLPNLITVASTDNSDLLAPFSNWGAMHVSIAAPGTDILTTKMGGDYQTVSGTSASAALVTGVAGLIKTERPWLNADRTREMILRGARPVTSLSDKVASKGIVSAAGSAEAIHTLPPNEGLDESGGNNGGEHGNNGNGRANQGDSNRPDTGNRSGNDDRHRDGREFRVTPPARTTGAPGLGLPNLDELRRKQPVNPKAADPVPSTRCSHKYPDCRSKKRQAAIEPPIDLLAWGLNLPQPGAPFGDNSRPISDTPFQLTWIPKPLLAAMLPEPQSPRTNVALAANGGTAIAQNYTQDSVLPGYHFQPSYVIDGQRYGHLISGGSDINGFWRDEHGLPSWIETDFNGMKVVDEVDVFTVADYPADLTQADPSSTQTFTQYGVTAFTVQSWNGSAWVTIPGGNITGNNLVWKKLTFTAVTTNKIRVAVNAAVDGVARIVEVEAWGTAAAPTNVAAAANGATVTAQNYTTNLPGYHLQPSYAIDGQRYLHLTANGSDADGFWRDEHGLPSWLEINFSGTKTIDEVAVFTFPDYPAGLTQADPAQTQTFTQYGVTAFTVQYWNGSAWVTVPGGNVTGNNLVWKKINFSAVTTDKIKVIINSAVDGVARIAEVEAWGTSASDPSSDPTGNNYSTARLDPNNRTGGGGVDLLSGNANWSLPILSLKGRAGLDLGLSLSYNSLVWTKSQDGASIKFDADRGMPSPGFRLGFPVIQPRYYNSQVGVNAYLLITPSGGHTELRQVGTSNTYEAADSSYLQLIDGGNGSLILTSIDGTQLSYNLYNGQYQCGQIKDRNGNFISVSYYSDGRINTVTDTLARIITFNYDAYLNLSSITQDWGGVTHPWVNFGWGTVTMQTSFTNMTVVGPQNGAIIPVITQVSFSDGSRSNFNYTAWGQVYQIASYGADSVLRNWTGYNLPGSEWLATSVQSDCPRFTEQKEWAGAWNNNQVVSTSYSMAGDHSSGQVTMPDGTIYKELFATIANWQKGLTTGTEYWSANVKKKWTATSYTQDDTNLNYQKNPRPTESNIYDAEGNHKRTGISYTTFTLPSSTSCSLPADVYEYNSDAATLLRRTHTDYRYDSAYLTRRIIGLVDGVSVYDGAYNLASKVRYDYDWPQYSDLLQDTPTTATQHDDVNYSRSFCYGRANKVWEMRYDVTDPNNTNVGTDSIYEYYTTGSVIYARDPSGHAVTISYTDSFSDTAKNSLNTFAYPTTITDPDGFASTTQYNYDFGAATRTQRPAPAGQTQGAIQTFEYDSAGRTTRVNQVNNGGYQRWVYDASGPVSTFSLLQTGGVEAWAVTLYDGVGRVRASGGDNPNSTGGYRAQFTLYDVMGRATDTTNPSEINGSWVPAGDDAAGWAWTHQAYDWKGRPTLTTNPDGTTKEAAYGGCGCAGGAVVTVRDELGRQQRVTSDILGRTWKTEVLDWYPSQTVYSTTTNTYNVRDQVTSVYQQAGSGGTGQTTSLTYDGHGRLKTQQSPSQTAATTYAYNRDDTVLNVTDGRGAITNLTYNNRHQATNISYSAPTGITPSTAVSFAYDSAGNRTSMTDGSGSVTYAYDQLSRLTSEGRTFAGPFSSTIYTLSYGYNLAGGLTSVTDPTGAVINYAYDQTGRTTGVTGSSFGGVTSYASNMQYRAWGAVKNLSTGDGKTTGVSYNSKLQPTDFSVGTSNSGVISKHYDYNSDGRLHYSQDQLDNRFDRSYTYDYMGRVTEAFSGPMARGLADTTNRPYKQYYQYDAMGHLTGRVGSRLWGGPGGAFGTDTYLNNRNTQWQYDADGRLTSDMQTQYTFDAAGRVIFVDTDGSNQTLSYDGDGVKTKIVGTDMSTNVVTTIYQVTSSVLGSVVTELDQSGQKTRGFVYSNGEMVAWQQKSGSTESVLWKHSDQNNASYRMAGSGGVVDTTESRELDPLNSDAGTRSPYTFPSSHPQGEVMSAPGFADAVNSNCRIDGVPAPCSMANNMLRSGAGYKAPSHSVTGVYSISERRYVGLAIWGFNPSTGQTGYWAHGTTSVIVHIDGYPDSPGKQIPWTDFVPVNTDTFSDHSPQQTGQSNESACARLAGSLVHYVIRYLSDVSEPDHASAQLGGFMAQLAINTYGKGHDDPNLKTDGFKDALVKDGQGGDVYKHIYGHAGMTLLGNRYLFLGFSVRGGKTGDEIREAQLAQDIDQRDHPNKYPGHSALEAATEVRDDIAARAVGEFMRDRFSSKINNTELRQNIFDTLCDH